MNTIIRNKEYEFVITNEAIRRLAMNAKFLTPVVTAFNKFGKLDYQANQNIYDYLINHGMDGIVLMGSTGEFFTMSMEQKKELILLATSYINKRIRLLIGVSCMSASETIELANFAHENGADGVLVIPPYYFSLSEESVEYYFDTVADRTEADIYMYNFPDRTGYDISPDVVLKLIRKHKNIVGYKDTITTLDHTRELIKKVKPEFPDFEIYSGFDDNFVHNILSGGDGCIGGLSNFAPEVFSSWTKAVREENLEEICKYQRITDELTTFYSIGKPFIPYVKKAMIMRGVKMEDYCSIPFLPANDAQTNIIEEVLKKTNLI